MSALQRLMFGAMYRLGLTPWDGHPIPPSLRAAAEAPVKGRALDIGCGTGDTSVYLAGLGWEVVAVDFVRRALDRARAKADAAGAHVDFVCGDVTRLAEAGIGTGFDLIVDNGCMHGLSDAARDAVVANLTAVAAPGATLSVAAFPVGARRQPRGMDRDEIERRFAPGWDFIGGGRVENISNESQADIHVYELRRKRDATPPVS